MLTIDIISRYLKISGRRNLSTGSLSANNHQQAHLGNKPCMQLKRGTTWPTNRSSFQNVIFAKNL